MKNLIYVMALGLLVFTGCSKEESIDPISNEVADDSAFLVRLDSSNPTWEKISVDELTSNSTSIAYRENGNSEHMHGKFSGFGGSTRISFSGTENNGGTHGHATLTSEIGAPFDVTLKLTVETECLMIEGNEGVYVGLITDVENNPFPAGGPYEVGNKLIFKVIDNGEGSNAELDQFSSFIIVVPAGMTACGVLSPDFFLWSVFPLVDVADNSENIKIN